MVDVNTWLHSLGLGQYTEVFDENAIEWDQLPELDHDILKEIGVKAAGHRMRILAAAKNFQSAAAPQISSSLEVVEPTLEATAVAEAERRQLTVMFADLVDSTRLSQQLDPEDLREMNRAYQDAAKASIEQYGGYVARYMGDGVLAYFGYPRAHEDDAERAVRAGLDLTSAVCKLATSVQLSVRVGIATGPVVVGDIIGEGASQESAVVGETPNLAARLEALAGANAVVIGDQTRRLTRGAFVYGDLGEHSLKGFDELKQAWEVRGEARSGSRFEALRGDNLAFFIGREHDLGMLLERWERALGSMLRRTRQSVHKRIAQVLESEYPTVSMNEPEVLAYHFSEAKETGQAIDYWHRAGQRAAERFAYVETVSHLSSALRLLPILPESEGRDEQELALQVALGPALMAVEGFASDAVEQAYTRARQLCERTGKTDHLFQTMYGLFRLNLIRAQYEPARALAKELLIQAEAEDDRTLRITAHRAIGNSAVLLGEGSEAQFHLARGAALYDRDVDRGLALLYGDDPGVDCLGYLSLAQWWRGHADQGLVSRHQAVALARELSHPFSLGHALGFSCIVQCCRRDFFAIAEDAQELLELSTHHGIAIWKSIAEIMLGIGLSVKGQSAAGRAMFGRGLANYQATGARIVTGLLPALLADALARAGDADAGSEALKAAIEADDNSVFWDAEYHRIKGDLDGQRNAADSTIEASYRQALTISRTQGARALELRAATALARFWCQRGKGAEALELLLPVFE